MYISTSGPVFNSKSMTFQGMCLLGYLRVVFNAELFRGHGGRVVKFSPPTSEIGVWFLARTQVGKLVVACSWSAVYSTEP